MILKVLLSLLSPPGVLVLCFHIAFMQPWAEDPMHERQTLYKLRIIHSPWLTGSKVCSRFHLLSFLLFLWVSARSNLALLTLSVGPSYLQIFLRISGSVNLKLLQLNRSVTLAPNTASLSHQQLQFPDTSLFLLVCFDLSSIHIWIKSICPQEQMKAEGSSYQELPLRPEISFSCTYVVLQVLSCFCHFICLLYESQPCLVTHTYICHTWEAEMKNYKFKIDVATEEIKGPQQQLSKTLSQNNKCKGTGTMVLVELA